MVTIHASYVGDGSSGLSLSFLPMDDSVALLFPVQGGGVGPLGSSLHPVTAGSDLQVRPHRLQDYRLMRNIQKLYNCSFIKLLTYFFCLLFLLTFSGCSFGQEPYFTDGTQLSAYLDLNKSGQNQFEFTCSADFYEKLKADDFFELYHVIVRGGIDYAQVMISYNDFRHFIQISNAAPSSYPWADCADLDDVRQAALDLARNQNGFILLCPWNLTDNLSEGNTFHRVLIRSGIESYRVSFSVDAGIIRVSGINYLEVPYAVVQDYAQFASAAAGFETMGINDFYIVFDADLFERITNDPQQYTIMVGSSRLGSYRSAVDPVSLTIRFSSVEFTDAPREICRTVADVPEAIKRMGAAGIRDFELIFPDTQVFDALYRNDFELLLTLEARAGMSDGKISYSTSSDRIIFSDAVITADAVMLASLSDAITYVDAQMAAGENDIHLFCTEELFYALMGDLIDFAVVHNGMNRIYDLIAHNGIFKYDLSSVRASHVINIHINQRYPGTAVMQAVRTGNSSGLNAREHELWNVAAATASGLQREDPLTTARAIHDWLCEHVVYIDDEFSEEDDNAIGAVLNGRANCDGYSDAFYLLGSLAGLNIRYQHGDSYYKDPEQLSSASTHLWNLLEINGEWRMVDVTWDDQTWGITYEFFNIGRAAAHEMYFWNEDMTVSIAEY